MKTTKFIIFALAVFTSNIVNAQFASQEDLADEMELQGFSPGTTVWTIKPMRKVNGGTLPSFTKVIIKKGALELSDMASFELQQRKKFAAFLNSLPGPTANEPGTPPPSQMQIHILVEDEKENEIQLIASKTNYWDTHGKDGLLYKIFMKEDPRKKYRKWGRNVFEAISHRAFFIGMTADQTRISLGMPDKVNTTTGKWGTHEQWIYGDSPGGRTYIYMENRRLVSYQQ